MKNPVPPAIGLLPPGRWGLQHAFAGALMLPIATMVLGIILSLTPQVQISGPANSAMQLTLLFILGLLVAYLMTPFSLRDSDLGLKRIDWRRIAIFVIVGYAVHFAIVAAFEWYLGIDTFKEAVDAIKTMGFGRDKQSDIFTILAVTLGAPLGEEMVFRNLLYRGLRDFISRRSGLGRNADAIAIGSAVILSSLLFMEIHQGAGNSEMLPAYFGIAVVYAIGYQLSGSFYVPVLIHGLNNSYVLFHNFARMGWPTAISASAAGAMLVAAPFVAVAILTMVGKMTRSRTEGD